MLYKVKNISMVIYILMCLCVLYFWRRPKRVNKTIVIEGMLVFKNVFESTTKLRFYKMKKLINEIEKMYNSEIERCIFLRHYVS